MERLARPMKKIGFFIQDWQASEMLNQNGVWLLSLMEKEEAVSAKFGRS